LKRTVVLHSAIDASILIIWLDSAKMKSAASNAQINITSRDALCQWIEDDAWTATIVTNSENTHALSENYKIILTFDRVNVLAIESEVDLYQQVKDVNKTNKLCNKYKQAISENKLKLHSTELKHCKIIDDVLFRKDLLWVSENMHTKLLKKIHDQSFIFHSDNQITIDLVQHFYYWSDHWATIRRYIWNCHAC